MDADCVSSSSRPATAVWQAADCASGQHRPRTPRGLEVLAQVLLCGFYAV
ncbi:hypothetical protein [Pseudomonas taiwanensis]|nr:hypothetical protein [Pseudomonas taiwanensis]